MLLMPWVIGAGIAGRVGAGGLSVLLAALALFVANHHAVEWSRPRLLGRREPGTAGSGRRMLGMGALGLVLAVPAMVALGPGRLVALALIATAAGAGTFALIATRKDHALAGQVLAAVALPLAAPAAYLAAGGTSDRAAIGAWLVAIAHTLWAVFYVRLKIRARMQRAPLDALRARLALAAGPVALQAACLLLLPLGIAAGALGWLALLAVVMPVTQTVIGAVWLHRPVVLKRVGLLLVGHAAAYGLLVAFLA
jgi:hypothetical protein